MRYVLLNNPFLFLFRYTLSLPSLDFLSLRLCSAHLFVRSWWKQRVLRDVLSVDFSSYFRLWSWVVSLQFPPKRYGHSKPRVHKLKIVMRYVRLTIPSSSIQIYMTLSFFSFPVVVWSCASFFSIMMKTAKQRVLRDVLSVEFSSYFRLWSWLAFLQFPPKRYLHSKRRIHKLKLVMRHVLLMVPSSSLQIYTAHSFFSFSVSVSLFIPFIFFSDIHCPLSIRSLDFLSLCLCSVHLSVRSWWKQLVLRDVLSVEFSSYFSLRSWLVFLQFPPKRVWTFEA